MNLREFALRKKSNRDFGARVVVRARANGNQGGVQLMLNRATRLAEGARIMQGRRG